MSESGRSADDARAAFQSCKSSDPRDRVQFYSSWVDNYEKDHALMSYRAPHLAVSCLSEHFTGNPEKALVLDVACGTGWVAKLMFELGFRHFVGVDGSEGMLQIAEKTGLYQDLKLVLLGPQPLPVQTDVFDVVTIVGALDAGFVPVSAVRELCRAAKPGGFVCMVRGNHRGAPAESYKKDLEAELQRMEEEGLWSRVAIQEVDRYMEDPHLKVERDGKTEEEVVYISGKVYFYKKSVGP